MFGNKETAMLSIPDHRKNINSNECCFAFETEICGSDGDFLNYVSTIYRALPNQISALFVH